jgi:hypothetical protein
MMAGAATVQLLFDCQADSLHMCIDYHQPQITRGGRHGMYIMTLLIIAYVQEAVIKNGGRESNSIALHATSGARLL